MEMHAKILSVMFCALAMSTQSLAQDELSHISPENEKVSVGLAGAEPPDIARFLLARGAISNAQMSPDGAQIAFLQDHTGTRQLWVLDVSGDAPRQITFGNGVTFFEWAPNSLEILYGADNNGDEQESYYLISADGLSERLVLPAVSGGFRQFGAFSNDGAQFSYASTERNGIDYDIYVAGLASGQTRLVYEGSFFFGPHAWSPDDSKLIVTETVGEDSDNLYLLDIATGDLDTLFKPDIRANFSSGWGGGNAFHWAQSASGFYFSTNHLREFLALVKYDIASGELIEIAATADRDIQNIELCGGRYLAWAENANGVDTLKVRDLRKNRAVKAPNLPSGTYRLSCASAVPAISIRVANSNTPGDIYVWNFKQREARRIFSSTMAGINRNALIKPEALSIPARDGVMLQGLLYLPSNLAPGTKPPVLFVVHGGPTGESRAGWDPVTQYHLAHGIAVFKSNVRGSTGFGRTYLTLDDQKKRLDSVRDLIDMLAFLDTDGRVDASRAAVKGGSYGGYMVNAVLGEYPEAFIAGVSLYGVGDWVTGLQVASPALKASDRIEYGDIRKQEWVDFYTENSPVRNADKISVPVLYSHGAMDPRIDKAETEVMVRALRAKGIEAPYILMPDEGHGWRKLSNRLFYYRREAAFLKDHLDSE
jgi:dipeptidyl aminopeptidase/acylaminoacyl peptidase